MRFRPCIDLHEGCVKQIVGSSLRDSGQANINFAATESAEYFADMYRRDGLVGGHVIMLGPGNEDAAKKALQAYPDGLQIGGGINPENAVKWLEYGASKVIVTSYLFDANGIFCYPRLEELIDVVGIERLVLDLSCIAVDGDYYVAANRWQTVTKQKVDGESLMELVGEDGEILVHAVDVEGKQQGIDEKLVVLLGEECPCCVTYAGGIRSLADLEKIDKLGNGRVDVTVGSALDIFGGNLSYNEVVNFDRERRKG